MPSWTRIEPAPGVTLSIAASPQGLCRISFTNDFPGHWSYSDAHPILAEAVRQLSRYFDRSLRQFDLPLDLNGTAFQRKVWDGLLGIPYGQVISYAELAGRICAPKAFRAVGAANGRNPVPIIVPCHRVINADGGPGGYSCGLSRKLLLLGLEGVHLDRQMDLLPAAAV